MGNAKRRRWSTGQGKHLHQILQHVSLDIDATSPRTCASGAADTGVTTNDPKLFVHDGSKPRVAMVNSESGPTIARLTKNVRFRRIPSARWRRGTIFPPLADV